jgi:ATP-binding cassette subfamily C protein/ATP-binding cassette subfamily C protein LapB
MSEDRTEVSRERGPAAASPAGDRVGRRLHGHGLDALASVSAAGACLVPLLEALGWRGEGRQVAEALPHFVDTFAVDDLIEVMANLHFACRGVAVKRGCLDARLLPCLLLQGGDEPLVVLRRDGDRLSVFDGRSGDVRNVEPGQLGGRAFYFAPVEAATTSSSAGSLSHWLSLVRSQLRRPMARLLWLVWSSSLIALALPLGTLALYDWVIPARSFDALYGLAAGLALLFAFDVVVRFARCSHLARLGGRLDHVVGVQTFRQLLGLPIALTGRAAVGSQLARLRQFDALRDLFSSPIANIALDLPFAAAYLAVIVAIAGAVAWIPIVVTLLFVLAALVLIPRVRRATADASEQRALKHAFLVELVTQFRGIKSCGAEAAWLTRCRQLSARTAIAGFRAMQMTTLVQTVAQALVTAAGIAVLVAGAVQVVALEMTVGAMVACMALTWRWLSPVQAAFVGLPSVAQSAQTIVQLDRLMRLKPERPLHRPTAGGRRLSGDIVFSRVSMRYGPTADPALNGLDLAVNAGELIMLTGPNGAGKSTILKLIAGLHTPQAGAVLIDGLDIRQLDCAELRHHISFVPQSGHLFFGTIAQNLRLADPLASDAALHDAARDAGVLDDILALPDGFDTRLGHMLQPHLPASFVQRLMLARAYVRDCAIYLFDEPARTLDSDADALFVRKLGHLRQRATVITVTHRPSHMRLADRLIHIEGGRVLMGGPPADILARLAMR